VSPTYSSFLFSAAAAEHRRLRGGRGQSRPPGAMAIAAAPSHTGVAAAFGRCHTGSSDGFGGHPVEQWLAAGGGRGRCPRQAEAGRGGVAWGWGGGAERGEWGWT